MTTDYFDPRDVTTTFGYGVTSLAFLIHGPTKVGKTRLAATTGALDKTIILAAEPGLVSLREYSIRVYEMTTIGRLFGAIEWLERGSVSGKLDGWWVFLDSATDIADRLLRIGKTTPMPNGKLPDPRHVYLDVSDAMTEAIKRLRMLRCNTVVITEQERIEKPDKRIIYAPSMPGQKLSSKMGYRFDLELAMHAERDGDNVQRWLQTVNDGQFECGDRTGVLDPTEPPNLAHIAAKIMASMPQPEPVPEAPAEGESKPANQPDNTESAQ
jgi:hypothetical protein